jgi:hypothetical protein
LSPGVSASSLLEACTTMSFALRRFDIYRASLHEVFLHLAGGEHLATGAEAGS